MLPLIVLEQRNKGSILSFQLATSTETLPEVEFSGQNLGRSLSRPDCPCCLVALMHKLLHSVFKLTVITDTSV